MRTYLDLLRCPSWNLLSLLCARSMDFSTPPIWGDSKTSLYAIAATLCLLSVTCIYTAFRPELSFRVSRRQTGCVRPTKYPHQDRTWGRDLTRQKQAAMASGSIMSFYDGLFRRLGSTWEEVSQNERIINTMDAANIKHVTAIENDVFIRHPTRIWNSRPLLGNGIFNSNGDRWKSARDLLRPAFVRSEVGNLGLIEKHTERLMALLPRDGETFDAQPLLKRLFLDTTTEQLFGKSTDSLLPESSLEADRFLNDLNSALGGMGKRRAAGIMSLKFAFDRTWKRSIRKVHAFIDSQVKEALAATETPDSSRKPLAGDKNDHNSISQTTRHILLDEMTNQIRDPIELRYQILNIFLPGRDTTAVLLSNILFHLSRNPSLWEPLRAYALSFKPSDSLTFESIKSMSPILDVIHETLRLNSPGGRSSRWATRDSVLPTGGGIDGTLPVFVARGTAIQMSTYSLHRNPEIWGGDADEFKPQRWKTMRHKLLPWQFLPFLGGPGICPAQQLVLVQATYVLWRLLREFSGIECRDEVVEFVESIKMLVESRNGAKIALLVNAK